MIHSEDSGMITSTMTPPKPRSNGGKWKNSSSFYEVFYIDKQTKSSSTEA